jgi:hypothetical protein
VRGRKVGDRLSDAPATWPGDRGYAGGSTDTTTSLLTLGARQYDPAAGRLPQRLDPAQNQHHRQHRRHRHPRHRRVSGLVDTIRGISEARALTAAAEDSGVTVKSAPQAAPQLAEAGPSVFRTPRLGSGPSELRGGLNPASHVEGDQSAYVGTENVARDYANPKIGGYENGYVKYDLAQGFGNEFAQYQFPYVTTSGEAGFEWQIPMNMIDRFNELTVNRTWIKW